MDQEEVGLGEGKEKASDGFLILVEGHEDRDALTVVFELVLDDFAVVVEVDPVWWG